MEKLAVIPARSGSKGLRDKNILELCGKPLMAYSIMAALESGCFSTVMVSTDSEVYAEIARKYGAEIPFLRSKNNSSDKSDKWDVVNEVLDKYSKRGFSFEDVCVLQPTSPLRNADDIRRAYDVMERWNADAVVSVCECLHPPMWSSQLGENGNMNGFDRPEMYKSRQELGNYYQLNGAIFIAKTSIVKRGGRIYESGCYAYVMDKDRSIDIDSELDFKLAGLLMEQDVNV
nr:acylneuraminate cytidylyltransferase family protein [Lachnospiraceae bacterium C1.1]